MQVVGIITEYNPFHRGHEYQIRYVRETLGADYVIVAMSGDFVQRGAPALMEKYLRAEMALLGGADLVLELPIQVSTASAEGFAAGGVSLLDGLGCVDELCFGSECGDTEILMETARILVAEPPVYRDFLQKNLRDGMSFPLARSRALTSYVANLPSLMCLPVTDILFFRSRWILSFLRPTIFLVLNTSKPCCARTAPSVPMRFSEKEVGITLRISRMFPEIFSRLLPVSGNFFPPKRTPWIFPVLFRLRHFRFFPLRLKRAAGFQKQLWIFLCTISFFWKRKKRCVSIRIFPMH